MRQVVVRPISTQTTADAAPRLRWPSERHLAPSHCGHCGARLLVTDYPTADNRLVDIPCLCCARTAVELISDHAPVQRTPAQWRALPKDPVTRGRPRSLAHPEGTAPERLVRILGEGGTMHPDYLADRLGVTVGVLRNAVQIARQRGHRIETDRIGYRLEARP